jgi:hypothetical protein
MKRYTLGIFLSSFDIYFFSLRKNSCPCEREVFPNNFPSLLVIKHPEERSHSLQKARKLCSGVTIHHFELCDSLAGFMRGERK